MSADITTRERAKLMDRYITEHYVLGFDIDALYGSAIVLWLHMIKP